jgi:hypothetical protein
MTEELARVRMEVEQRLNDELSRALAEAERLRDAELARAQADAAALREAAAREARQAAEAAAALALEAEVARVRSDAEAQLQAELRALREQAEHARLADQTEAKQTVEKVRDAAIRDSRAIADAANHTLEAEIARVREDADARLQAELEKVRLAAEQQRREELEEIRAQVAEMREAAARQARAASAQAIAGRVVLPPEPARVIPAPSATAAAVSTSPVAVPAPALNASVDASAPATTGGDYYSLFQSMDSAKPEEEEVEEQAVDRPSRFHLALQSLKVVPSKWALPMAACLLIVVGGTLSMGWSWHPDVLARDRTPEPVAQAAVAPRPVASGERFGGLEITTDPAGAQVMIDGSKAGVGVTPLSIARLKAGRHTVVIKAAGGTLTRRVDIKAGETAHLSESIFSGFIAVFSSIPVSVNINGRNVGSSDSGQMMVAPGAYAVELANEHFNFHQTVNLKVEPGQVASYSVTLPTSPVHIDAPDGTTISIDGTPAGQTPLADVNLPIGAHEIVAHYANAVEKRQSVDVKSGGETEITLR